MNNTTNTDDRLITDADRKRRNVLADIYSRMFDIKFTVEEIFTEMFKQGHRVPHSPRFDVTAKLSLNDEYDSFRYAVEINGYEPNDSAFHEAFRGCLRQRGFNDVAVEEGGRLLQ